MSNLKVAHKLLAAFAALVIGVVIAGALVAGSLSSIQKITALNEHSYAYIDAITDTTGALVEEQNAVRGYVASLDASFLKKRAKYHEEYEAAFKRIEAGVEDADEKARADALVAALEKPRLEGMSAEQRAEAERAGNARRTVDNARKDAERGGDVVDRAVSAMTQIEESSAKIGKGFAVVAQEVRALAQRSAEAAKEIKALIGASTQQVDEGVGLVGETGEALRRIIAGVQDINHIVAEIAASAVEQSTGLQQVNTAVNQMDQATQQNAAMVEQSTAASHALSNEARELGRLVQRFRLAENAAARRAA